MSQRHDGREPCPYRILDDVGGAFAMGCAGGAVWYAVKGARNSPVGERVRGGLMAVKARAPILGGNFAVWGGLFSCFDCTLVAIRHKEDPWNSITAGAATGGVLAARAGYKVMAKNAAIGGVLLALIEGLGVLINQMVAPPAPSMGMEVEGAVGGSAAPPKITQSVAPPTATITMGSSDNSSSGGGGDYYSDSGSKSDGMEGFDTGAGVAGGRSDTYSNQAEMKSDPYAARSVLEPSVCFEDALVSMCRQRLMGLTGYAPSARVEAAATSEVASTSSFLLLPNLCSVYARTLVGKEE